MKITWGKNSKAKRQSMVASTKPDLPFGGYSDSNEADKEERAEGTPNSPGKEPADTIELLKHQGNILAEEGKYQEALGKWEAALTLTPDNAILHEQKAQVLLEVGDTWRALTSASRATVLDPLWPEAWVTLGRAQLNFGEPDSAILSFDKALELKPDYDDAKAGRETATRLVKKRGHLRLSDIPIDSDNVAADLMETTATWRCADSDDDSYTKTVLRRMTLSPYEIPGMREIVDYTESVYPWERDAKEEGAGGRGRGKEEEGMLFLKVKFKPQSLFVSKRRRESRWDEHQIMRMVKSKSTAASPLSKTVVDPCPETVDSPLLLCSSTEVLAVRVEMHECFENGISCRCLFKSKTGAKELSFHNDQNERYWDYAMRFRHGTVQAPSYAHVFPKLSDEVTPISFGWVKPTTWEGDIQYIKFFDMLMEATEYGHTQDHVRAKAVVLARKSFQKILFFQLNVAVQDCMQLLEHDERMNQRCGIYYSIVSQIVLNNKDCKDLVNSIKAGESGLSYNLTEFAAHDVWESVIANLVNYLVTHLHAERESGRYKEWVCDKVDLDVAKFVTDTVNDQFGSSREGIYLDLLLEKMKLAQDLGLVPSVTAESAIYC